MKKMNPCNLRLWMGLAVWLLTGPALWAAIIAPTYVGNLETVEDLFGRPIKRAATRDASPLVEIRTTAGFDILPPAVDGSPAAGQTLVQSARMGDHSLNNGKFCVILTNNVLAGGKIIFARLYNAPTAAEATFYADSAAMTASDTGSDLLLEFGPMQQIDPRDLSGSGLGHSLEQELLAMQESGVDSDGDGFSDYNEYLAGTDMTDAGSLLAFKRIQPADADGISPLAFGEEPPASTIRVSWLSVPGRTYNLYYSQSLLPDEVQWDLVAEVTAGENEDEIILDVAIDDPQQIQRGNFQVRVQYGVEP